MKLSAYYDTYISNTYCSPGVQGLVTFPPLNH